MNNSAEVKIVDLKIPFSSMVTFMVKWAFAAIPAIALIAGIWFLIVAFLGTMAGMQ